MESVGGAIPLPPPRLAWRRPFGARRADQESAGGAIPLPPPRLSGRGGFPLKLGWQICADAPGP